MPNDYILRSDVEKLLNQMISDANSLMYPEGKTLEMEEFNILSCGKASIEILKDRLSSIQSVDRWIPVSERLPEEKEKVLCTYLGVSYQVCVYYGADLFEYAGEYLFKTTHWMPLPSNTLSHD